MDITGEFLRSIVVYDCGLTKVRLGSAHDGGYVVAREVCDLVPEVYSFGVGDDTAFEIDFSVQYPKAVMHLFDPFVDDLPTSSPKFHFSKTGIGRGFKTEIVPKQNAMLKLDVEYAEWDALKNNVSLELLALFSQVVIEFHIVHVQPQPGLSPYWSEFYGKVLERINNNLFGKYMCAMGKLAVFFRCIHIHANNSLPLAVVDGYKFPPLIEMTFVRKDLIPGSCTLSKELFPVAGLDSPNKTDRMDVYNYYPMGRERERKLVE